MATTDTNPKWYAGAKIRATKDCSGTVKGGVYTLRDYGKSYWGLVEAHCDCIHTWELINNQEKGTTPMSVKLTPAQKANLTPEIQTLVKAGFVYENLLLAPDGETALNSILMETHKEALVKLAQEKLDEEKEAK